MTFLVVICIEGLDPIILIHITSLIHALNAMQITLIMKVVDTAF